MTHASLFSGIGGFDIAAEWMRWENIFHCEWNPFSQKVLKHHFPNSISYNDITKTDFNVHKGRIEILTGGFPFQPYSSAGKRLGKEDPRHLWPEMCRAIREIQPRWIVGENVRGLTNWNGGLVFNEVQISMEAEGYEVLPFLLPACSVNAPHRRDRIWFIAYCNNKERWRENNYNGEWSVEKQKSYDRNELRNNIRSITKSGNVTNSEFIRLQQCRNTNEISTKEKIKKRKGNKPTISIKTNDDGFKSRWENFPTQSPICGGDDGIPKELDNITFSKWKKETIKAYGNAIVPQVAYEIFKTIQYYDDNIF
jgi:DNA (cytosine-5)-methyltransferase 1